MGVQHEASNLLDVGVLGEQLQGGDDHDALAGEVPDHGSIDAVSDFRRVRKNVDATGQRDANAFQVRRMGEHERAPPMRLGGRGGGDVDPHRLHLIRCHDGAREQLGDVRAGREVVRDEGTGLVGRCGLAQLGLDLGWQVGQVVGQRVRGIERHACRADVRARDLPAFDAASQRGGDVQVRSGVDDRGEAGVREHVLQLVLKGRRVQVRGVHPLGLREVDVGIPEAGEDHAAVAGQHRRVGWQRDAPGDRFDPAVVDQHRGVDERRNARRRIDPGVRDGDIGGPASGPGHGDERAKKDRVQLHVISLPLIDQVRAPVATGRARAACCRRAPTPPPARRRGHAPVPAPCHRDRGPPGQRACRCRRSCSAPRPAR